MLDEIRAQVRRIPRGRVMTYGEVAAAAGYPGAARQVVWALRNSGPALPWHRVVGAGLRIKLPGEAGLEQQMRLESEGWIVNAGRVKKAEARDLPPSHRGTGPPRKSKNRSGLNSRK